MDENVKEFRRIAQELCDLYERKNADYGNAFGDIFEELGIISAVTRMEDKMRRFKRIASGNVTMVKEETIIDTLADLAAYSIMTIIELEKIMIDSKDGCEEQQMEQEEADRPKQGEDCRVVGYLHKNNGARGRKKREHDRFCPTCRHMKADGCEALKNNMPCVWTLDKSKVKPLKNIEK